MLLYREDHYFVIQLVFIKANFHLASIARDGGLRAWRTSGDETVAAILDGFIKLDIY